FAYLFDEYGTLIEPDERNYEREYHKYPTLSEAIEDGRAATGTVKTLKPDTVYYVMINGGDKADYSLRITDPEVGRIPVSPKESSPESSALLISANQDEAPLISTNVRYQTTYEEGCHWFAIKTGEEPVPYTVTLENLKPGSSRLYAYLFDAYGTLIEPDERNYEREYHKYPDVSEATDDGRAATGTIKTLETETVYYVRVSGGDASEYTLMVADSTEEVPETGTAAGERDATEGGLIVPGTSQSSALNIPIGTKVHGKYAGGYSWLAFTTAEEADIPYRITMVNETYGSGRLYLYLFDELGTQIDIDERNYEREYHKYPAVSEATEDGRAATGTVTGLKPNTTYFLRLQGSDEAGYSVLVTMPEKQDSGVGTSGNIEEAKGTLSADDAFYTGTNQNNAVMLKTNTRYHGNYTEGWAWAAFTTTAEEGAEYSITVENLTPGSSLMYAYLYDEFGTVIEADERNYEREYHRYPDVSEAGEDGTAATGFVRTLQPDTTYYISLSSGDPNEYIIMIGAPEKADAQNTIKEEPAEAVFEVPFELNETQVRFVANQAVFADEEAAREALKPVAEVILAHPDHPILLAGTTATFGDQGACEDLSRRRAEAIRDMLVNEFGVTGSQLITAGLGYENDPFVRGRDIDSAGNFVETEGAKNRRVIILDAESETAQKILN
ncbi:MAG: OmpA family protein, partial [Solobacterium sp.]|nr:OmpA family protein [Solobacterium sp.]